ncbi:MAG: DUF1289 domain-containing protein [Pseudomonadota bacterium]
MATKIPSPCVDVCKFKRAGHCIGCGMSKRQKKKFKSLKGTAKRLRFISELLEQHQQLGGYPMWPRAYRKVCRKKAIDCPLDGGKL